MLFNSATLVKKFLVKNFEENIKQILIDTPRFTFIPKLSLKHWNSFSSSKQEQKRNIEIEIQEQVAELKEETYRNVYTV